MVLTVLVMAMPHGSRGAYLAGKSYERAEPSVDDKTASDLKGIQNGTSGAEKPVTRRQCGKGQSGRPSPQLGTQSSYLIGCAITMGSLRKKEKSPGNCQTGFTDTTNGNALMPLRGERTEKFCVPYVRNKL